VCRRGGATGQTALEKVAELAPDVVFLDIQRHPDARGDGLTVAAAIVRQNTFATGPE
jgi:CheY-like chemotaxis protein